MFFFENNFNKKLEIQTSSHHIPNLLPLYGGSLCVRGIDVMGTGTWSPRSAEAGVNGERKLQISLDSVYICDFYGTMKPNQMIPLCGSNLDTCTDIANYQSQTIYNYEKYFRQLEPACFIIVDSIVIWKFSF